MSLHPPVDNTYRRLLPWYHTGKFDEAATEAAPPCPERIRGLFPKLDWVIVGGESGPGARPFDLAWARSIVADCKDAGVACFVKQLGAKPIEIWNEAERHDVVLHHPKGGDPAEWPIDLRVREFPMTLSAKAV